jgi:hypothetical protein
MARGIADGEKDRFIEFTGLLERVRAPRAPIHWVMRVLEKIGTGFCDQSIGFL